MTKTAVILLSIIVMGSIPFAFADRSEKLEFAGTLEETLGHFWALELNLDEQNAELALVHATHPIAELYDTMSSHLTDNPSFNEKLKITLLDLQNKASTEVSREDAQMAIYDAKQIIEEARTLVVGEDLSNDPAFKMQLINGLLETAKVEYHEAVHDGIIGEMAEFQDGSAFVWRSQQVYQTISDELDPMDSARIDELYGQVWSDFDSRADPENVDNSIDAVIYEFVEISGFESVPSEHEEEAYGMLSPLKQIQEGVEPQNVSCKPGMELVFKPNGNPACVKHSTVDKIIQRGWTS